MGFFGDHGDPGVEGKDPGQQCQSQGSHPGSLGCLDILEKIKWEGSFQSQDPACKEDERHSQGLVSQKADDAAPDFLPGRREQWDGQQGSQLDEQ